jgi:hypothetical protein
MVVVFLTGGRHAVSVHLHRHPVAPGRDPGDGQPHSVGQPWSRPRHCRPGRHRPACDEILDNRENTVAFFDATGVSIPAAVSTFAHETYKVPRSWAERAYPNLVYFNALDRGNHFAALQEPALFTELRAAFRTLR